MTIQSEFELPDLPAARRQVQPDVLFRLGPVNAEPGLASDETQVIAFRLAGKFQMNQGREIVVDALPNVDWQALRLILLGRAMAALLRQRGWLPLHASGVAIDGRAVLFLGPSGAGKSTTAAALHARGHKVITDDVGAVQTVDRICTVRSGLSRLRLADLSLPVLEGRYRNSANELDKLAVNLHQEELPDTWPVARLYIIDFGSELRAGPINPLLAAASLSVHSFVRRWALDSTVARSHLQACVAAAEVLPVYQIIRPRNFASIPDLVRLIEENDGATS